MKTGKRRMRERRHGLVEYALLLVLVGMVVIASLIVFDDRVQKAYYSVILNMRDRDDVV